MLKNVDVKVLISTSTRWRRFASPVGLLIAAAIGMGASPAFGQACPQGAAVSVLPLGEAFLATAAPGAEMTWSMGPMSVTCPGSHFEGTAPTFGKNVGDPVIIPMTEPDCPACTANNGLPVSGKTNTDNGRWFIKVSCGGRAALHIPRAGANATMGGCTMTLAPNAAFDAQATWTNGSPSKLAIDAEIPVAGRGTGCPPLTPTSTIRLKATYAITPATAVKAITVTPVRR